MGECQERIKFDSLSHSTKLSLLINSMVMTSNQLFMDPTTNGFFKPIEDRFNDFYNLFLDRLTEDTYEEDVRRFCEIAMSEFPYLVPEDVVNANERGWLPDIEPVITKVKAHLGF